MKRRKLITDIDKVVNKLMEIKEYHGFECVEMSKAIRLLTDIKSNEIILEVLNENND